MHATPKAESGVRNEMFSAKALGWTSSYLWWFGWMVIWGESESQTKKHLQSSFPVLSCHCDAAANPTAITGSFMPLHKLQQMDVKQRTNTVIIVLHFQIHFTFTLHYI